MKAKMVSDNDIMKVIDKHHAENLTVRRLGELIGYSPATTHERLLELEKKGLIRRQRRTIIEVVWRG